MDFPFKLTYSVNGTNRETSDTNGDVYIQITETGGRRTVCVKANRAIDLISYYETGFNFNVTKKGLCFINGYQSWTDTKERYLCEKERDVRKMPRKLNSMFSFDRYGDAYFYNYDKEYLHSYDIFYCDGGFIANLNTENAYLIIKVKRKDGSVSLQSDINNIRLLKGEEFTVCDYLYKPDKTEGFKALDRYFPSNAPQKIFGYTSWYNYYQDINEEIILRDLDALDNRFNLFQIDDGFETFVGDWLDVDAKKFPNGLETIVKSIHNKGLMAGLWLAPFVAEEKSKLFREKPEWFKKESDGTPFKCGANWSGFYALDLENGEVRDYIRKCLNHYSDMGFDFFKLDFLYASSLPPYSGKTRSKVATEAYKFLREVLGDKLILGCGATLLNGANVFDYMRIGPDVSLKFDDVFYMRFMHRERISTKVTLQNTVYRSIFDGRFFGNDPDVFLLRDDNISLSDRQKNALITINALFGSVMMTSDNIAQYDSQKQKTLSEALELFKNGKVTGYKRKGHIIKIEYVLDGKTRKLSYNTRKGVIL